LMSTSPPVFSLTISAKRDAASPTEDPAGSATAGGGSPASFAAPDRTSPTALIQGVRDGQASAVLAASIFHFGQHSVAEAKRYMAEAGLAASFNALQQRLGRKAVSARMLSEYPAFVRLYDVLVEGREDVRALPWTERRARLEAMRYVLTSVPYDDKDEDIVGAPDPRIVGIGPNAPMFEMDEGSERLFPTLY